VVYLACRSRLHGALLSRQPDRVEPVRHRPRDAALQMDSPRDQTQDGHNHRYRQLDPLASTAGSRRANARARPLTRLSTSGANSQTHGDPIRARNDTQRAQPAVAQSSAGHTCLGRGATMTKSEKTRTDRCLPFTASSWAAWLTDLRLDTRSLRWLRFRDSLTHRSQESSRLPPGWIGSRRSRTRCHNQVPAAAGLNAIGDIRPVDLVSPRIISA
jgi:hypothetical protein